MARRHDDLRLDYAIDRLRHIERDAIQTLDRACVIPGKSITGRELQALLVTGQLPMRDLPADCNAHANVYVHDLYDLSAFFTQDKRDPAYEGRLKVLHDAFTKARDEVVLDPNAVALAIIDRMEKATF